MVTFYSKMWLDAKKVRETPFSRVSLHWLPDWRTASIPHATSCAAFSGAAMHAPPLQSGLMTLTFKVTAHVHGARHRTLSVYKVWSPYALLFRSYG